MQAVTKSYQHCSSRRLTTLPQVSKAVRQVYLSNVQYSLLLSRLLPLFGTLFFILHCRQTHSGEKAHNRCSENFYKREVESDIRAQPSKSANEQMKTLELLKKFEEETANDLEGVDSDDDDHLDIAQRFAGLNLGIVFNMLFYIDH